MGNQILQIRVRFAILQEAIPRGVALLQGPPAMMVFIAQRQIPAMEVVPVQELEILVTTE